VLKSERVHKKARFSEPGESASPGELKCSI
jgi:hypothetical protein